MLARYADYEFYKDKYLGQKIQESMFDALALQATNYINYITFGRIDQENAAEDVKLATCAVAEVILKNEESGGKSSETVGKLSVTYNTKGTAERKMYSAAYPYLAHTGLLYRGARK